MKRHNVAVHFESHGIVFVIHCQRLNLNRQKQLGGLTSGYNI